MKVELSEGKIAHVRIIHEQFCNKDGYDPKRAFLGSYEAKHGLKLDPGEARGVTLAELTIIEGPDDSPTAKHIYLGASFCAPVDGFNRAVGLKKALARAFKKARGIKKEERTKVWTIVTGGKYNKGK